MITGRDTTFLWHQCAAAAFFLFAMISAPAQGSPVSSSAGGVAQASVAESVPSVATPGQAYRLPPEKLAQAKALGRIRPSIHFGSEFWEVGFLWLMLASGKASQLGRWIAVRTARPWLRACAFSAVLILLLFLAVDLPFWAIAHAFSLHYGIGVEGWPGWLLDASKALGLNLLIETPVLMLASELQQWDWSRRRYWAWFAAFMTPLTILGAFLLPALIEPLFNTFEPLSQSHPALVQQLEKVVARTGTSIPPERMFLMKASEKSNGLNAYVTGLGASKRIVVWDTTADRMPEDEILFTFAHETGHYVLHHIAKGLAAGCVGMFVLFWAVAKVAEGLVRRWGSAWRVAAVASLPGLAVLLLAFALVGLLAEPIENAASRYIEHEADVYGQEAIHGLVPDPRKAAVAAFNRLGEAYLDEPNPDPFLEFWTDSHPSTQRRATFAEHYDPWATGQTPRFFSR